MISQKILAQITRFYQIFLFFISNVTIQNIHHQYQCNKITDFIHDFHTKSTYKQKKNHANRYTFKSTFQISFIREIIISNYLKHDQKTFIKSVKISFNAQICEKVFHQISLFLISNTVNQESNTNRVKSYAAKRCPVSRENLWAQKGVRATIR